METLPVVLILLGASVASVILCRRYNLPPILGYLLVGTISGPHALSVLENFEAAEHLAEFGVVFLMFSIGLEFSLPRLIAMRRIVLGLGCLQVLVSILCVTVIGQFIGMSWQAGVALGGVLAMSSTAVLTKLLSERMEIGAAHGRDGRGVLLFQDLAVIPLLILIPAFSQPPDLLLVTMGKALLKSVVLLTLVFILGKQLLRRWLMVVARGKSAELFVLNVLFVTLGLASVTQAIGLSMSLGAFVAGMLISETQFRHQVEEDIKPFRDVLLGLFFITVGMMLDFSLVLHHLAIVLLVLCAFMLAKFALIFGLSRLVGSQTGVAMRTGLWLCAGGEFGFVLLSGIREHAVASTAATQIVLAVLVLSMLLAPLVVLFSDRLVLRFTANEWLSRSLALTSLAARSMTTEKHVLICGYGRSGQYLGRFMAQEGVSFVALDLDPDRVREAAAAGENVVYGNAMRRENLIAAGINRASVVVISFADTRAAEIVLEHVRVLVPELPVIVRSTDEKDLDLLQRSGAAEVVPETLETAIMLASNALIHLGIPINRVLKRARLTRSARYRTLRGFFHGESDRYDEELDSEEQRLRAVPLLEGAYAIGRTPDEVGLCALGVEVNGIRRKNSRILEPSGDIRFEADDVAVLLGTLTALASAEDCLINGPDNESPESLLESA